MVSCLQAFPHLLDLISRLYVVFTVRPDIDCQFLQTTNEVKRCIGWLKKLKVDLSNHYSGDKVVVGSVHVVWAV